jgi:cytochrome bd-type quinol oxidase subunit 2
MKLSVKLFKNSLIGVALIFSLSALSAGASELSPATAFAITPAANEACQGVGLATGSGCSDNGTQVSSTLNTFINIFSAIVGIVAVIMIIIAGLQFITSGGNAQNVTKARSSLLYAIVGLIVVVSAQLIVHFVITQATTAAK